MINQFPEIKQFFIRDQFSETDLEKLIEKIDIAYEDRRVNKRAHELIRLELLKFKMESRETPSNEERANDSGVAEVDDLIEQPKRANVVHSRLESYRKMTIQEMADALLVTPSMLIRILNNNGYSYEPRNKVAKDDFYCLEDFIKNKIDLLKRQKKREQNANKRVVKSNSRSKKYVGVFGKMQKYGRSGKIIYIRSK